MVLGGSVNINKNVCTLGDILFFNLIFFFDFTSSNWGKLINGTIFLLNSPNFANKTKKMNLNNVSTT